MVAILLWNVEYVSLFLGVDFLYKVTHSKIMSWRNTINRENNCRESSDSHEYLAILKKAFLQKYFWRVSLRPSTSLRLLSFPALLPRILCWHRIILYLYVGCFLDLKRIFKLFLIDELKVLALINFGLLAPLLILLRRSHSSSATW